MSTTTLFAGGNATEEYPHLAMDGSRSIDGSGINGEFVNQISSSGALNPQQVYFLHVPIDNTPHTTITASARTANNLAAAAGSGLKTSIEWLLIGAICIVALPLLRLARRR